MGGLSQVDRPLSASIQEFGFRASEQNLGSVAFIASARARSV